MTVWRILGAILGGTALIVMGCLIVATAPIHFLPAGVILIAGGLVLGTEGAR